MVSGYFSGSTSTSASAAGVTQPAQILTRGNTAASSTSGRSPARARRHAAVLPPGPPPTTMRRARPLASPESRRGPQPSASGTARISSIAFATSMVANRSPSRSIAPSTYASAKLSGDGSRMSRTNVAARARPPCTRARPAERHDRAVPETEREAAGDAVEHTVENLRGSLRADIPGKDHVCTVAERDALIPGPPAKTG